MKARNRNRRGIALIYTIISLPVVLGFCAFAVDFGYVELAQFQLQQVADASAHDYMVLYNQYGGASEAQAHISTTKDSVFNIAGSMPSVSATWGYWNAENHTFSTTSSSGATTAVQVTASCTQANGNALPLMFGSIIGCGKIGVTAISVATDLATTATVPISATSNLYFAGMPSTITNTYGDTGSTNAATSVTSIPVVPGSTLTFSTFTGTTSVCPGSIGYFGPAGATGANGTTIAHGVNWDGTNLSGPSTENGIADAVMPESALVGMFLDDSEPDSTPAPTTVVDWTQSSVKNQTSYTNLALKTPFYIGTGTYAGTTKTFQVPPGAKRFFIGIWDGVEYNNNAGSLSGSVSVQHRILIVQ